MYFYWTTEGYLSSNSESARRTYHHPRFFYMRCPPLHTRCHLTPVRHLSGLPENYQFRNRIPEHRYSFKRKILHLEAPCRSNDIFHWGTRLSFEAAFGSYEATYSYSNCPHRCNSLAGASKNPHAIPEKNLGEETQEGCKSLT